MPKRFYILLLLLLGTVASTTQAQERGRIVGDTATQWRAKVHPLDRFDLILMRGFLMTGNSPDSVPIRGGFSGSNYVGGSYNFPLFRDRKQEDFFKAFWLRAGLGFEFFSLNYSQDDGKTFPSAADTLNSERQRFDYIMLNLGFAYTLIKDRETDRVTSFFEIGTSGGINIGSRYKVRREFGDREARIRFNGVPNTNLWRAALYSRVTYKFLGLWVQYSLTEVFDQDARYINQAGIPSEYPELPHLEFGLNVIF